MSADLALVGSATLLGLVALPHCALMCSAPCAAVLGPGPKPPWLPFLLARFTAYAAAGGVAAASVAATARLAETSPALRPLWVMLHAGLLLLGLWLLWHGRQPGWMGTLGRRPVLPAQGSPAIQVVQGPGPARPRFQARATLAGLLWVAWPCGVLQSALLLASLTGSAAAGAAAMAGFAAVSSAGLLLAPWAWKRLRPALEPQLLRLAGAMLAGASAFALGRGVWQPLAAWCGLG